MDHTQIRQSFQKISIKECTNKVWVKAETFKIDILKKKDSVLLWSNI